MTKESDSKKNRLSLGLEDISPSTIRIGLKLKLTPVIAIILITIGIALVSVVTVSLTPELNLDLQHWFFGSFKYYLIYFVAGFFPLTLWLLLSRFGNVPLGQSADHPRFSRISWFAMILAVGTGVELIFWGINEPIYHIEGNPFINEELTNAAAVIAMRITFYHWGFHPWSIFAIFGLCVAYSTHRKSQGFNLRHTLSPIFGNYIKGPLGTSIDTLLVMSAVLVVSTSLIFGTLQLSKLFQSKFDPTFLVFIQLLIIILLTTVATLSSLTGLHRGIKILSYVSLASTAIALSLMAMFGPTGYLFASYFHGIGDILSNLFQMSVWVNEDKLDDWQEWWTLFYWCWWILWAPFVGTFIAAISKGRTVREYLIGVVVVPSLVIFLWHTLIGKTSLYLELVQAVSSGVQKSMAAVGNAGIIENVKINQSIAITTVIENIGLSDYADLALYAIIFIAVIYYVTCADSATWVINNTMPIGQNNQSTIHHLFWGAFIGVFSAMVLISDGFNLLQTITILFALPISLLMLLMVFALLYTLAKERVDKVVMEP